MLSRIDRNFVEAVKHARSIRIVINAGYSDELQLVFDERRTHTRKLTHDVAIAIQDYFNNSGEE